MENLIKNKKPKQPVKSRLLWFAKTAVGFWVLCANAYFFVAYFFNMLYNFNGLYYLEDFIFIYYQTLLK